MTRCCPLRFHGVRGHPLGQTNAGLFGRNAFVLRLHKQRNHLWQERGTWHKRRFSDIDLDDMVELTRIIDPEMRPALYKRIADIALFLSGIFPEHAARSLDSRRNMFSTKHTLKDYEQAGKRFYHVAAQETDQTQWKPVLGTLAEKFTLARLALNSLSNRYVKTLRSRYFQSPAE